MAKRSNGRDELAGMIDRLGEIKEMIQTLEKEEADLVAKVKALGVGLHDGKEFAAEVYTQERSTTDWWKIVEKLKIPGRVIADHTKVKEIVCCRAIRRTAVQQAIAAAVRNGAKRPPAAH